MYCKVFLEDFPSSIFPLTYTPLFLKVNPPLPLVGDKDIHPALSDYGQRDVLAIPAISSPLIHSAIESPHDSFDDDNYSVLCFPTQLKKKIILSVIKNKNIKIKNITLY